jgi:hypothetical protein
MHETMNLKLKKKRTFKQWDGCMKWIDRDVTVSYFALFLYSKYLQILRSEVLGVIYALYTGGAGIDSGSLHRMH